MPVPEALWRLVVQLAQVAGAALANAQEGPARARASSSTHTDTTWFTDVCADRWECTVVVATHPDERLLFKNDRGAMLREPPHTASSDYWALAELIRRCERGWTSGAEPEPRE